MGDLITITPGAATRRPQPPRGKGGIAMIKLKARASTINATSTEKLREYANDDGTFDETTLAAIRAELARREQAQAVDWPQPYSALERAAQPENLRQYKSALANMEQTINDLHRKNDSNNALMTEAAQKIGELRIENARLRSLLAELTEAAKQHITCMNLNLPNRGLTQKEWASREELRAAIAAAKEAING